MDAHQVSTKLFLASADGIGAADYIRVFHSWIQTGRIDETLIDVTDYSHVHDGPGVLLLTHAGQYGIDYGDGQPGLQYLAKRDDPGPLAGKLRTSLRRALHACHLLEQTWPGRLAFRGNEVHVRIHSRLLAPNNAATAAAATPQVQAVMAQMYGEPGARGTLAANTDKPEQLFTVRFQTDGAYAISDLLQRLPAD
jgi:hypothetical protein